MGRLNVLFFLYLSSVLLWVTGSWPSVCWCVFDSVTDACFLFVTHPRWSLSPSSYPVPWLLKNVSQNVSFQFQVPWWGTVKISWQGQTVQATAQGLKLKAFGLTPNFSRHTECCPQTQTVHAAGGGSTREVLMWYICTPPSFPDVRGTFFLLRMDSFACCMLSYSFDISLGGENSRISWTFPDMFHSEPSKRWQPQAGGTIPVSGVLFVISLGCATQALPCFVFLLGCLIPDVFPPYQHLAWLPDVWVVL